MLRSQKGFNLIELVIILAVVGTLAGAIIPLSFQIDNKQREERTVDRLDDLRVAVTGNPVIILNEARTSFGYVGDMGVLPPTLEDLYKKGTQFAFVFNTSLKIGAGWNGPYINPSTVEFIDTLKKDAFGNDFDYTTTPFTDPSVGETVEGRVRSLGKDGSSDTTDDLTHEFFKSQVKSKVFGFVKDDEGQGVAGVSVTLNYPMNGTLTTALTTTDSKGLYIFDDIPYGNRSITIDPKLVLSAGSAAVTGPAFDTVEFSVTNFSSSNVTIMSFKAVYNISPPAFYSPLRIAGSFVYSSTSPRLASGSIVTFPPITIIGGAGVKESFPIRIQSPVTEVADLFLGELGRGASIRIEMQNFRDTQTGAGTAVDMTGIPFECTFSDGSMVAFTP